MADIKQFIEVCAKGDVEQASRLLESRKSFFLFKKFFQSEFINTKHDGTTALISATKGIGLNSTQRLKTVQLLLEKGADVNIASDDGFPTLHYAQANGDIDVMNLILDHGADVNAVLPGPGGWTLLHVAAMTGGLAEVRVLLEHGAAADITDVDGKTAAHMALEHGHSDIVAALIPPGRKHDANDPEDAQAILQETVLADLNSNSTKLWKNTLPNICFVGAPFEGNMPDDTAGWVAANRDLMIAKILEIDDSDEFERLQVRIDSEVDKTILIPDITADEIQGQNLSKGSMLDRSLRVMVHEMSLIPEEFEYLTSVFLSDALDRCSPVSFCFAFRK